jgi:hypothetical protein
MTQAAPDHPLTHPNGFGAYRRNKSGDAYVGWDAGGAIHGRCSGEWRRGFTTTAYTWR